MKKFWSLLLCLALAMGLCIWAAAADDASADYTVEISLAEDGGQYSFTGDLKELLSDGEEAEFWYRTRYGFLLLRQDGTFSYKADAGNEAVQAAAGETCLLDKFTGTFYNAETGKWVGREVRILLAPDGASTEGYFGQHTVTDLSETVEGTLLMNKETTQETALRVPCGRLALQADGAYEYYQYNFLEAVQSLDGGQVREDVLPVCAFLSDGSQVELSFSVRTTGVDDLVDAFPQLRDFDLTLYVPESMYDSGEFFDIAVTGLVLYGSVLGDGGAEEHTFSWAPPQNILHGIIGLGGNSEFWYVVDNDNSDVRNLPVGQELTDNITYTYEDNNGSIAHGTLTIHICKVA